MDRLAIINKALRKIRQPKIDSLNSGTPRAVECNEAFESVRDETIILYEWSDFVCRKKISCEKIENEQGLIVPKLSEFGGYYLFKKPKNFLRKICINREENEFRVEGGHILAQGDSDINLLYLGIKEDETKWPSYFCNLVAYNLAIELSDILQSGTEELPKLTALAADFLEKAKHNDSYNKPALSLGLSEFEKAHLAGTY